MIETRIYKVEEICTVTSSKRIFSHEYKPAGVPFYRSSEVIAKALGESTTIDYFISEERFNQIKQQYGSPQNGEILLSAVGNRSGIPYYIQNEQDFYFKDGNLVWFKDFQPYVDSLYLCYWLGSRLGQDVISSVMIGSAQRALTISGLMSMRVPLPPLPIQKRIAEILSSLDDKIELNRQMNQTLEEMAQAMFKHYFVDGIDRDNMPEGWRIGKLQDVCNVSIGRTPPRLEKEWFQDGSGDYKWISIRDIGQSGTFIFDTSECLSNEAVKKFNIPIVPSDTIILSFKLTVGRIAITTEPMLSNEAIAQLPLKTEAINKEFLYMYLKGFDYDTLGNTSSIATAVNSKVIKDLPILLPIASVVSDYGAKTSVLFDLIKSNLIEINSLVETRDYLLPKLVSGEVMPAELNQLEKTL